MLNSTVKCFVVTVALAISLCGAEVHCAAQDSSEELGFQTRHGDEIMVCGKLFRIGAPVKLWLDPGGYDAYRTDRRFSDFEKRKWLRTMEEVKEGKLTFGNATNETAPDRYGMRYELTADTQFTPEELAQIRGGGWPLELLQKKVDQFVLHFDVCGTSGQCFYILHDMRGLSVHFMLDVDGTIYQTLDLKERAWHATKSNDRSIGIEIANIGAYAVEGRSKTLNEWYQPDETGKVKIVLPAYIRGQEHLKGKVFRPRKNEPVIGTVRDTKYAQYDYTEQQYASLIKLSAALCTIFPQIKPDIPRTPDGKVLPQTLTDEQWASYSGILGHYHVQTNKSDPGPALDWEYLVTETRKQMERIKSK